MPPKKRNRGDNGLKIEPDPDHCDDKEQLKNWVKELLTENGDLKTENTDLKQRIEGRTEDQKKAKISRICRALFSCPLQNRYPLQMVFYPNPWIVSVVEEKYQELKIGTSFPTSTFSSHFSILKTDRLSEVLQYFKGEKKVDPTTVSLLAHEDLTLVNMYLNVFLNEEVNDGDPIVVGATAPYNFHFQEELKKGGLVDRIREKYQKPNDIFNGILEDPCGRIVVKIEDSWLGFDSKFESVNCTLREAPSFKRKMKILVSWEDGQPAEVIFDLDRMIATSKGGSVAKFSFDFEYYEEDDLVDSDESEEE